MATVKYEIDRSDGWVEVAADAVDFLLENQGEDWQRVRLTLQTSAPAADAPYHDIYPHTAAVRIGTGAAYISTSSNEPVLVIVST